MRARPDRPTADRVAVHRGRPTRARPALRGPQGDGAPRLPVLLPAPLPRPDEPPPTPNGRRADRRLHPAADDLRPTPPTAQRPHPTNPEKPALRADRPRTDDRRLLHQDLRAD